MQAERRRQPVIRTRFAALGSGLNERSRRLHAAAEAKTAGYGGIAAAARATGIARSTIGRGLKDLADPGPLTGKVRRPGSGRPTLTGTDPTLLEGPRELLAPATMGDPMRPLLWVSKSHAKLAVALRAMGHKIAARSIPKLPGLLKYRRQVNRKTLEGSRNPDRNAQFEHINATAIATQTAGQPVISVDTKKKEPIGPYKNGGSDDRPEGCPDQVNVHDFVDQELGKVVPYGVYDIAANAGCELAPHMRPGGGLGHGAVIQPGIARVAIRLKYAAEWREVGPRMFALAIGAEAIQHRRRRLAGERGHPASAVAGISSSAPPRFPGCG